MLWNFIKFFVVIFNETSQLVVSWVLMNWDVAVFSHNILYIIKMEGSFLSLRQVYLKSWLSIKEPFHQISHVRWRFFRFLHFSGLKTFIEYRQNEHVIQSLFFLLHILNFKWVKLQTILNQSPHFVALWSLTQSLFLTLFFCG